MLLYDRLLEHAKREQRLGLLAPINLRRLHSIEDAGHAVYELTDVVPLFSDWETEKAKKVPRRPPHPHMWAEWQITQTDKDDIAWDWITGVVISNVSEREEVDRLAQKYCTQPRHIEIMNNAEEVYTSHMFRCLNGPIRNVPDRLKDAPSLRDAKTCLANRAVVADMNFTMWALKNDACDIDALQVYGKHGDALANHGTIEMNQGDEWNILNCNGTLGLGMSTQAAWCAWPAFMAFALLHCRNVETINHTVDEHTQRECKKHSRPPRSEWKTLSVQMPKLKRYPTTVEGVREMTTQKRFHLRSGHFKNLTHPRYLNHDAEGGNWHWFQSCYVGDPELGTIRSTHKLKG
jgi:hypothetical protein